MPTQTAPSTLHATLWPRPGAGLAAIRGEVLAEDGIGIVMRYSHDGREQVARIPWSAIARVELHQAAIPVAAEAVTR